MRKDLKGWYSRIVCISLVVLNPSFAGFSYSQSEFNGQVVGIWLFDEIYKKKAGKTITYVIKDASGNGHDALLVNEPKLREGRFGMAMEFSQRRGSHLLVPDHEGLQPTEQISILAWVRRPPTAKDTAPYYILAKGNVWQGDDPGYGIALHKVFNNMFYFWYKGGFRGTDGRKDDLWHHYAVVAKVQTREPTLYIDGELQPVKHGDGVKQIEFLPTPLGQTMDLFIGSMRPGRFDAHSNNRIDEVAIFNAALTQTEIAKLMKVGLHRGFFSVSPADKLSTSWAKLKRLW